VEDEGISVVDLILHSGVIDEGLRAKLGMKKHSKRKGDGGNECKAERYIPTACIDSAMNAEEEGEEEKRGEEMSQVSLPCKRGNFDGSGLGRLGQAGQHFSRAGSKPPMY